MPRFATCHQLATFEVDSRKIFVVFFRTLDVVFAQLIHPVIGSSYRIFSVSLAFRSGPMDSAGSAAVPLAPRAKAKALAKGKAKPRPRRVGPHRPLPTGSLFKKARHHFSDRFDKDWDNCLVMTAEQCGHLRDSAFGVFRELMRSRGWKLWRSTNPFVREQKWVCLHDHKILSEAAYDIRCQESLRRMNAQYFP